MDVAPTADQEEVHDMDGPTWPTTMINASDGNMNEKLRSGTSFTWAFGETESKMYNSGKCKDPMEPVTTQ
ncbi:hypothetical protein QJS10_CPB20g00076 [Acorus calamus]|uniref:Uncharacterized protein n=1 Tax=Acorus calamus TaxID=4465 RepID=A0AAV9CE13_ACOCL|nr:hypothetical protein QJS10_CPB20g00076 [Acorus calamus]